MDFKADNLKKHIALLAIVLIAVSCKTPLTGVSGNYVYKTECISNQSDGTIIVKAWGTGTNEKQAVEQARIKAVKDVLFIGIRDGKGDCGTVALLTDVNIYEKNETYFTDFFSKRGDYVHFVKDLTARKDLEIKPGANGVTVGLLVRILKADLKEKLNKDYNQLKR